MAEPLDITQLDLQNLPPEQAAELMRQHQAALAAQQHHALLGMLGTVPELQKAGAAQYGQAAKEREGGQQTAANIFKTALGEKEAAARLKELENQGLYQRGQLAVAMGQLKEAGRAHKAEEAIHVEATKPTVPANILQDLSEAEKQMAELEALGKAVPALSWITELAKKPVQAAHEATKKTVSKYRAMGATNVPSEGGEIPVAATPTAIGAKPPSDMVSVQVPGHPAGSIHRSQLPAFKAKFPNAVVGQ